MIEVPESTPPVTHSMASLQTILEHCSSNAFLIPAHGTLRLMLNHAKMAKENGFPAQDIFVVEDGMPVDFSGSPSEPEARITQEVCAGLVCVDGTGVGDVDQDVLEDRQLLATHGIVVCVATVDRQGKVQGTPLVTTKGVVREDDLPEIIEGASRVAAKALKACMEQAKYPHSNHRDQRFRSTFF